MHISGFTPVRISGTSRIAFFEQAAVGRAFSRATDCEAAWRSSLGGWSGFEIGFVRSGPAAAHGHQLKVASAGPKWGEGLRVILRSWRNAPYLGGRRTAT